MTVGILGGGQLGRMLALAGYPLGCRFRFLDPSTDAPAGELGEHYIGSYNDQELLSRFARGLEVVTYEFENVPVSTVRFLAGQVPVYPPPEALEIGQDRLKEKELFQEVGIPTSPFVEVDSLQDLRRAVDQIGLPAVLKTHRLGYDGKGQYVLRNPSDTDRAWDAIGGVPLLLEGFVPFEREVSVLGVRGVNGQMAFYPVVENHHLNGILQLSIAPAPDLTQDLQERAETKAAAIMETLGYVGVIAIEFFQLKGHLLANEMAPRVHNSGHWTIEGAETSQFENHLRAVLGLPLGPTTPVGHSAMLNLIGSTPHTKPILRAPGAHLHLYSKAPQPGRKLGHVTIRDNDPDALMKRLAEIRSLVE